MINGMSVLAVIPARGGSKGIKRKNLREVGGKPLIAWTINAANQSRYIDRLILSTDDAEICECAQQWGCEVPFDRPHELATDTASSVDVVIHALGQLKEKYDLIVLLQPTSPLRSTDDIDNCIEKCTVNNVNACVSVLLSDKTPYWMYHIQNDSGVINPVIEKDHMPTRRQDAADCFVLNGAVYVIKSNILEASRAFVVQNTVAYEMPKTRSIDIDTEDDIKYFEYLNKEIINNL